MAPVTRFEEIRAWQQARKLAQGVYEASSFGDFAKDYGLKDQIRRAAVSTMANIAEGFDCDSHREFARFLGIARRSVVEVQSLLYVAVDNGYVERQQFDHLYDQASTTKALISAFKRSLTTRRT